MKIIILGPPGAGKGTQSVKLSEELKMPRIVTGDILREAIKNETELGKKAKSQMESGGLVSDELVIDIVTEKLKSSDGKDFLFDGFPRSLPQAEALDKFLESNSEKIDIAVEIQSSNEVIVNRLSNRRICQKCGAVYNLVTLKPAKEDVCDTCGSSLIIRKDDQPDTIKKRLDVYREQTKPLIGYYNDKGIFFSVDGQKEISDIFKELMGLVAAKR